MAAVVQRSMEHVMIKVLLQRYKPSGSPTIKYTGACAQTKPCVGFIMISAVPFTMAPPTRVAMVDNTGNIY